jgi:alpha-L-rhamnosidase
VNGDTRETLFFNNCFWIYNLQTAAKVADALGRSELGARYRARSDVIRATVHGEFYRPEDQSYVNGFQAYLSIALLVGLPPQELQPLVAQRLEKEIRVVRKGHFWGGITGGSFIVKHLLEAGRNDLLYEMATKDDYPSWGDMIRKGATTLWEDWEGKLSLSHSSYLHIGAFFLEGLGGIRPGPNGRGYEDFVIQPGLWKGSPLTSMRCHFDSPQGRIESRWQRNQGQIEFEVVVPPNTAATFHLPTGDLGSVREGQRPIGQSNGVRVIGANDTVTLLRLEPGRYTFLLPWR